MPLVSLELPEELKETFINIDTETIQTNNDLPNHIVQNYKTNDVPYGILKGGNKPTYRQWNRTQKNYQPVSNNFLTNAPISEREVRLNLLKQKLLLIGKNKKPTYIRSRLYFYYIRINSYDLKKRVLLISFRLTHLLCK